MRVTMIAVGDHRLQYNKLFCYDRCVIIDHQRLINYFCYDDDHHQSMVVYRTRHVMIDRNTK